MRYIQTVAFMYTIFWCNVLQYHAANQHTLLGLYINFILICTSCTPDVNNALCSSACQSLAYHLLGHVGYSLRVHCTIYLNYYVNRTQMRTALQIIVTIV